MLVLYYNQKGKGNPNKLKGKKKMKNYAIVYMKSNTHYRLFEKTIKADNKTEAIKKFEGMMPDTAIIEIKEG